MEPITTILIISGAWHVPEHYARLSSRLQDAGFNVVCPRLMTNNGASPPNHTLDDDIAQIRNMVLKELDRGHDVLVLMHSYGGVVGSYALAGIDEQATKGKGKVRRMVYMSAFVPLENEALIDGIGGKMASWISHTADGGLAVSDKIGYFYNDLPPDEQKLWASQCVLHVASAQEEPSHSHKGSMAWKSIPATYIFCRKDAAIPLAGQEYIVNHAEQSSDGVVFTREYCDAGHSPMLSMPDTVVDVVKRAAK
jgi:pimeloyl-ACP methyl ester carboxylesterase